MNTIHRRLLVSAAFQLVVVGLTIRYGANGHPLWRPSSAVLNARPPRKKALLIGISYVNTPFTHEPLDASHEDVIELKKLMTENYGYDAANIVTMIDSSDPDYDPALRPTRSNIIRQMEELVQGSIPEDHFLFHFSGHATQRDSVGFEEEDGLDECLIPVDSNGDDSSLIVDNELRIHLVDRLCARSHLVAIFDACHSATMLDLPLMTQNVTRSEKQHRSNRPELQESITNGAIDLGESSEHNITASSTITVVGEDDRQVESDFFQETGGAAALDALRHAQLPDGFVTDSANVLTISACSDSQSTWEGPGRASFTKNIIATLRETPKPTLGEFIHRVSTRTYLLNEMRWEASRKYKAQIQEYIHMHGPKLSLEQKNVYKAKAEMYTEGDSQDPQISTLEVPISGAHSQFTL